MSPVDNGELFAPAAREPSAEPSGVMVDVALPVPLRRRFTYRWTGAEAPAPGQRVAVPFHGRKLSGIVLGPADPPPPGVKVKPVGGVLEPEPVFTEELLRFLLESADYYLHPVGEVLRAAAPALPAEAVKALRSGGFLDHGDRLGPAVTTRTELIATRSAAEVTGRLGTRQRAILDALDDGPATLGRLRDRVPGADRKTLQRLEALGFLGLEERVVPADRFLSEPVERDVPPTLNDAQAEAVERLRAALGTASTHLLHGVTGSGKTEVYLRVIEASRERGEGALLLVPEIALTPQLVSRLRARFGDQLAVLHSGLSETARYHHWRALRRGELRMAVGARSAIFAPVRDLGLIIVDEEHDPSFKQEEGFRYHARDLAILRAHRAGAPCILGSATPSLESFHATEVGRFVRSSLPERATEQDLPDVEVIDLRRHGPGPSGHPLLTGPLHRALERCLADDGQAILFLNRRGFAPSLRCDACSEVVSCPHCSVSLTEHRRARRLVCHYCDYREPLPERCPSCGARELEPLGVGTERLEDALEDAFAPARIGRLDRDTASRGRDVETLLRRFRRREIDVLVGTQMVTKGHDLPGVTLVGVALADQSLAFPDFRASERTFQLLSQVAGRAGRGDRPGRVLFQTYQPHHPSVRFAREHAYRPFFDEELEARREVGYAPFGRLVAVRVDGPDEAEARAACRTLAEVARAADRPDVDVLGPSAAPLARLRGRYRFRVLLRSRRRPSVRAVADAVLRRIEAGLKGVRAHVDVDPSSML